jgi:membrane protein YqaA with SNARE-associated domain
VLRGALESGLMRTLLRRADSRAFPFVVGTVALAATLSMSVPFATLLVTSVLMARHRWGAIAVGAILGAALGAAVLYLVFHHLGWALLFAAYPDAVRSSAWSDATRWLSAYGVVAFLVIADTPLPLTPALMFAGISRLSIVDVVLALWIGKLAKYLVYAWLASRFPERALQRSQRHAEALRVNVARALSGTPARGDDTTSSGELP